MTRSFRHWTLRYALDRLKEMAYHRLHPDHPWLTPKANAVLESCLKPSDIGLELGSGRSTLWFARRVRQLTSFEHDRSWFEKVSDLLKRVDNVDYRFYPRDRSDDDAYGAAYVEAVKEIEAQSLDFVLVDGIYRDHCARAALDKIQPGGLLIIDNANWFLPCSSRSPNSRTEALGPKNALWSEVHRALSTWRGIWTSSGVTDTALFFKPAR